MAVLCEGLVTPEHGKNRIESAKGIVLVRHIGMKKKALHEYIGQNMRPLMEYVSQDDVKKAKSLIIKAMREE